ncbi:hypothetical protein SAMN02745163_01750 [Clostridium cavendishii DSM 21758]|uniref:Polymerase/histidinol phosphatase N-terminal domain-containing protein n=2 Tax=Clostridium TaxID=1485 RepID=A0A1M6IAL1_9CLOT|nr:hypothetical protein SAMN02745163_01750 [Clostridium cavendishii DSM 21758]
MHTTASDGELTPEEVVNLAKEKDLDIISITDHNTLKGVKEAKVIGEQLGIKVIEGLELSTRYKGEKVHVLGYFKGGACENKELKEVLALIKSKKNLKLQELYNEKFLIEIDTEIPRITAETGIRLIHYFGGVAVLAHPVKLSSKIKDEVLNMDFDGIEAVYFRNSIEDTEFFKVLTKAKSCFYTAGSDFHTNKRLDKRHGCIADVSLNSEEIEFFISNLLI